MTTFADVIEDTRSHLMTSQPDRINRLSTTIDATTDQVVLEFPNKGTNEGSIIAIELEEMYVVSTSETGGTTTLTVIRNMNGSSAAAHTAGALVYINPQFTNFRIGRYVNRGLENLSSDGSGLFRVRTVNIAGDSTKNGYEVTGLTGFLDIWRVSHSVTGPQDEYVPLFGNDFYIDFAADTTVFPSGTALFLDCQIRSDETIRLAYRAKFSPLVNLTDDVLTVSGLHTEAHDLPALYAAIHLLSGREVKRTFMSSQPEPRRQEEVPPGAASQAMRPLLALYHDRLVVESNRLKRLYPRRI